MVDACKFLSNTLETVYRVTGFRVKSEKGIHVQGGEKER